MGQSRKRNEEDDDGGTDHGVLGRGGEGGRKESSHDIYPSL